RAPFQHIQSAGVNILKTTNNIVMIAKPAPAYNRILFFDLLFISIGFSLPSLFPVFLIATCSISFGGGASFSTPSVLGGFTNEPSEFGFDVDQLFSSLFKLLVYTRPSQ